MNCFSKSFVMKPIGLFKRGGRVPKKFLFWEARWNHVFFRSAYQITLLKHVGEIFFVLRNADFLSSKNASELSWEKVFLKRVLHRKQIIRHGWSVTLTYCHGLYGLSTFSNGHSVLRKHWVWQQKRKFGTVVNISLT